MPINLKKLQSLARRRLELRGAIEWKQVQSSDLIVRSGLENHTILHPQGNSLEEVDVLHALCKAKLNEMGFTTIEAAALDSIRICSKDDPKYIIDATAAESIVVETYSNTLLFARFPEESRAQRERMVLRFESSDALTSLHTQMGFWGTAGVSYYREASLRCGLSFPEEIIGKSMTRVSEEIRKEYETVNALLGELPMIHVGVEKMTPEDSILVVDIIVRLFSAKTGLDCD